MRALNAARSLGRGRQETTRTSRLAPGTRDRSGASLFYGREQPPGRVGGRTGKTARRVSVVSSEERPHEMRE